MKQQFVIAFLPSLSVQHAVRAALSHAVYMAQMLGKGLILLYIEDKKIGGPSTGEAAKQLAALASDVKAGAVEGVAPFADVTYAALKGNTRQIVGELPKLLFSVLAVVPVDASASLASPLHPRRVLRFFRDSRMAYLTVQEPLGRVQHNKSVALTVDYRRETKEKLVWASYFARFGGYAIRLMHEEYDDEGLRLKWYENMLFLQKLYANLGVTYLDEVYDAHGIFPETSALSHAAAQGYNLMVYVATDTRDIDMLELFIGTADQRIVKNKQRLPVLFLNKRDDIYVMCD